MAGQSPVQNEQIWALDRSAGKGRALLKDRFQQRPAQSRWQIIQNKRQTLLQSLGCHHFTDQSLDLTRLIPRMKRDLAKQRVLHHRKARRIAAGVQSREQTF